MSAIVSGRRVVTLVPHFLQVFKVGNVLHVGLDDHSFENWGQKGVRIRYERGRVIITAFPSGATKEIPATIINDEQGKLWALVEPERFERRLFQVRRINERQTK